MDKIHGLLEIRLEVIKLWNVRLKTFTRHINRDYQQHRESDNAFYIIKQDLEYDNKGNLLKLTL